MSSSAAPRSAPAPTPRFRRKTVAALLALFFGWMGAHWWYMGRKHAWMLTAWAAACVAGAMTADVWWDNPAAFLLLAPAMDGYIRAAVYGLTSDEVFDARYNPGQAPKTRTGWTPVLIAIADLLIGTSVMLLVLATAVLHVWRRLGWLDGYVL